MTVRSFLLLGAAFALLAPFAFAADHYKVIPWSWADVTGDSGPKVSPTASSAQWVNKEGITGMPGDHGLVIRKNVETAVYASAGASFEGMEDDVITAETTLGFTYRSDEYCTAGSPRFNVVATDGVNKFYYFVGGCGNSASTATVDGMWVTKTWTVPTSWFPVGSAPVSPAGLTIVSVNIIVDEGPAEAILDAITYNTVTVGEPAAVVVKDNQDQDESGHGKGKGKP